MNEDTSRLLFDELVSLPDTQAAKNIRKMRGKQENAYLDCICKSHPPLAALAKDDKKNYAKAISGFANSDGGVILWGVDARGGHDPEIPDVIKNFYPVKGVTAFCTHLDSLVKDATIPVVSGVVNKAVVEDQTTDSGFCLTYVPTGTNPPYRAELGVGDYYKRAASSFYPMQPYDIRDVIFRFRYPKFEVVVTASTAAGSDPDLRILRVMLKNKGPVSLRGFRCVLYVPEAIVSSTEHLAMDYIEIDLASQVTYRVYSVKSVVGSIVRGIWQYHIHEPVYPGEEVELVGAASGRKIFYTVSPPHSGPSLVDARIAWTVYADDLPSPVTGYRPLADLMVVV